MFDITLGGTKTWQGCLNAKEPVYLDAFACLCVASQCTQLLVYTCVLQPKPAPLSADVMQSGLCFYKLF